MAARPITYWNTPVGSLKVLSFRIPSDDLSMLQEEAERRGQPVSELIRQAIRASLNAPTPRVEMSAGVQDGSLTVHTDVPMFTGGIAAPAEVAWSAQEAAG